MALTESVQLNESWLCPSFELYDAFGKLYTSETLMGSKGLCLIFTCNHCPYAKAIWSRLIALSVEFNTSGINFAAINPNINPAYPQDSPQNMIDLSKKLSLPFPYLVDTDQMVAQAFNAKCTPDIYLIKKDVTLFYHGRLDDCWKDASLVKEENLKDALNLLISNKAAPTNIKPSIGCSIKWLA